MSPAKRSVLITGCSDGGMGAELAIAFHKAGLQVYATARNPAKMSHLASLGITTLSLDIQSESSIAECVDKLPTLDILVNNAGTLGLMPLVDVNIAEAKKMYDVNVWSHVAVIQAFLPLLRKSSNAVIANNTSTGAGTNLPFQSIYNSSKAALVLITDTLRLELEPFDIKVVDLRTSVVKTNIIQTMQSSGSWALPKGSIYEPAKEEAERGMRQEDFQNKAMPAEKWAKLTVQDLLKKNPPSVIWRGELAWLARLATVMPHGTFDGTVKSMSGFDAVEKVIRQSEKSTKAQTQ